MELNPHARPAQWGHALLRRFSALLILGFALLTQPLLAQPGGIGGTGMLPGGIGGTGRMPGGIGGTGIVAVGPIQRFGSVFVLGKEYHFTPQTQFRIDGTVAQEQDLQLGDVVTVIGRHEHGRWIALLVQARRALAGRIEQVNLADQSIRLLGQTVRITGTTRITGVSSAPIRLKQLHKGDWVRISALSAGHNHWRATAILRSDAKTASTSLLLRGVIEAVSPDRRAIRIGGQWLPLSHRLAAQLAPAESIVAHGRYVSGKPQLTRIAHETGPAGEASAIGTRIAVYGLIRKTQEGTYCNDYRLTGDTAAIALKPDLRTTRVWGLVDGTIAAPGVIRLERITPSVDPMHYGLNATNPQQTRAPEKASSETHPSERANPLGDRAKTVLDGTRDHAVDSVPDALSGQVDELAPDDLPNPTAIPSLPSHGIELPEQAPSPPEIAHPDVTDVPDFSPPEVAPAPTLPAIPAPPPVPSPPTVPAIPSAPRVPEMPDLPEPSS
ncbi:hypothetical protein A9404_12435 [Halothiobacillus diazotrophicus]|uniref:DUF5666 domain-containing protein n=2 Tax=Halothiobacillus diazotrophicus TaxID=1860122 RepID=A0A191ZJL0_9GAMM|nr:hypothetical protein A9404_12435 [Halothiobacillus diazotrophicus]